MSAQRQSVKAQKSKQRSRVGNGSIVLPDVDNRLPVARRIKELYEDYCSHLGGNPSEVQRAIAKRAAALVVWAESVESKMARGEEIEVAAYTTTINALHRYLTSLGLKRVAKDVTPGLRDYVANRYGGAQA